MYYIDTYGINMSLKHLYLDLNSLGVYPDLIISIRLVPLGDVIQEIPDLASKELHMNKYYGPKLHLDDVIRFNGKMIAFTMEHLNGLHLVVNNTNYRITTRNDYIIKSDSDVRRISWRLRPWHLNKMLLMKYKQITDLDSLCEIIRDIVK